jgi:predicted N-acyltransferase
MTVSDEVSVQIAERIEQIDEEEWDEICGDRPFVRHRWMRLAETVFAGYEPYYVQIRRHGRLEAGAACEIQHHFHLSAYLPIHVLQDISGYFLERFPPLNCMLPIVFEPGLLVRPGSDPNTLAPHLLEAMNELATRKRASFVGIAGLDPNHIAWPALRAARYHSIKMPADTYMGIAWSNFEDYQAALPQRKRTEFRRVRRRAGEAGVTVETFCPTPEIQPQLWALTCNVYRRHNQRNPYVPDLFCRARDVLGDDLTMLVARQRGDIIACMAMLRSGDTLALKWLGLDYERTLNTFTYHLIMTESIPRAIEMGVRWIKFGSMSYVIKKLVGAVLEDRFLALALRGRVLHWLGGVGLTLAGKRALPIATPDITKHRRWRYDA